MRNHEQQLRQHHKFHVDSEKQTNKLTEGLYHPDFWKSPIRY